MNGVEYVVGNPGVSSQPLQPYSPEALAFGAELDVYKRQECGYVDEIVLPTESHSRIAGALRAFEKKGTAQSIRKHGNIPL